jgi:hypothetical protein
MSTTPILDAIPILRAAVYAALAPLNAAIYWLQADQGVARPFVVYQSQDLGGSAVKRIGDHGWSGLVTVKAIADTQGAAEALYATVAPGMGSLAHAGYGIIAEFERPLVIPPLEDIWQSGGVFRVTIT